MAHRELCTLFDSNYLFKAVAMYRSMERTIPSFTLTCFCFDDESKRILDALALPSLRTVSLAELEAGDPELLAVKPTRSPVEYCWTSTPSLLLHVFATRPEVDEVTYIDADLLFFSDIEPVFDEMGDASVLITPHRYAPEYAHQAVNGIYCVEFNTFRRDDRGMTALRWWHDRCIEWCYYRLEDGKLGDQKYLDDWPERFAGVHVCEHDGAGLAPWNATRYDVRSDDGRVMVDDQPLVFFHYHRYALRARGPDAWEPPGYPLDHRHFETLYRPYQDALREAKRLVRSVAPDFRGGLQPRPPIRERVLRTRADFGARAVERFPFLLRVRYPRGLPAGR